MKNKHYISPIVVFGLLVMTPGCAPEARKERTSERATAFFKASDYEKAEIEFKNLLQVDPGNVVALEHLGLIWLERGAPLRALPFLLEVKKQRPNDRAAHLKILRITLSLGSADGARSGAQTILDQFPDDAEALLLLAESVRSEDSLKAARQALGRVVDRGFAKFQLATANLALFDGDAAAARTALRRAIAMDPKFPEAHSAMAAFHQLQNNPAEMGKELKLAAELSPTRSNERMRYIEYQARMGSIESAAADLKEIVGKAPDYLPAWSRLAQIAIAEKKFDEALALLRTVYRWDPGNYEGREVLSQLWLAKGDGKKAIEEMELLARDHPTLAGPKFELARLHLQNREESRARALLKDALIQNPDHEPAILLLATLTLRSGDPQASAALLGEFLTRRPHHAQAQMLLLDALGAMRRFDDIIRILSASIIRDPANPRPYFLLGLVLLQQEKLTEARQSFEKTLEIAPEALPAVAELVKLDLKAGNSSGAMRRVQAELTRKPDSAPVYRMLAGTLAVQGKWDEVENAVLKGIELEPGDASSYALLARALLARKDAVKIAERLDEIVANMPENPAALTMAGDIYLQLNRNPQARDFYEKALARSPDSIIALNNLAFLYSERLDMPERALDLGKKARQLDPSSPSIADTLGWILFKRKEYPQALELLQESATKMPDNPEVQFHLGAVSQAMGQKEAARAAYQRAASTPGDFPGKAEIKDRLAQLDTSPPPPVEKQK